MVSQDLANDSFKKLALIKIKYECFPLEEDVLSRLV